MTFDRIGLGTVNPQADFHLVGNSIVQGNVTIGLSSVANNPLRVASTGNTPTLYVTQDGTNGIYAAKFEATTTTAHGVHIKTTASSPSIYGLLVETPVASIVIGSNGRIGVGTNTPEESLHVVGNVKVTGSFSVANFNPTVIESGSLSVSTISAATIFASTISAVTISANSLSIPILAINTISASTIRAGATQITTSISSYSMIGTNTTDNLINTKIVLHGFSEPVAGKGGSIDLVTTDGLGGDVSFIYQPSVGSAIVNMIIAKDGRVGIGTNVVVSGVRLGVSGNTVISGALTVSGATILRNTLSVTGPVVANGDLTIVEPDVVNLNLQSTSGSGTNYQNIRFKTHAAARGGGLYWENTADSNFRTFFGRNYNGGSDITGLSYKVNTTNGNTDTSGSTHLFIKDSDGNVGLGTTNPTVKLQVVGAIKANDLSVSNLVANNLAFTNVSVPGQISVLSLFAGNLSVSGTISAGTVIATNISGLTKVSAATVFANNLSVSGTISAGTVIATNISGLTKVSAATVFANNLSVSGTISAGTVIATNISGLTQVSAATVFANNLSVSGTVIATNISVLTQVSVATVFANNLSVSGNINIDSGTLFVNSSTGNVGIGTLTPSSKLHVVGTANVTTSLSSATVFAGTLSVSGNCNINSGTLFVNSSTGNVGIGTATPTAPLHIDLPAVSSGGATTSPQTALKLRWTEGVQNLGLGEGTKIQFSHYLADVTMTEYEGAFIGSYKANTADDNSSTSLIFGTRDTGDAGTGATERMRITNDGYVGIGTTTPSANLQVVGTIVTNNIGIGTVAPTKAPLEVLTGTAQSSVSGYYFNTTTGLTNGPVPTIFFGFWTPSIYGAGYIWSGSGFIASSDRRIKKDIVEINDDTALQTLRKLKPSTYRYIDTVSRSNQQVYGFIAQEVKEVLPYAVSQQTEVIPDIYKIGMLSNGGTLILPDDHDISANDKLRIMTKDGKETLCKVTSVIDSRSVTIDGFGNEEPQEVFVYGREVQDFHVLQKEAVFTVGVSAIQELDRKVSRLEQENAELKAKLDMVLAKLNL